MVDYTRWTTQVGLHMVEYILGYTVGYTVEYTVKSTVEYTMQYSVEYTVSELYDGLHGRVPGRVPGRVHGRIHGRVHGRELGGLYMVQYTVESGHVIEAILIDYYHRVDCVRSQREMIPTAHANLRLRGSSLYEYNTVNEIVYTVLPPSPKIFYLPNSLPPFISNPQQAQDLNLEGLYQ